MQNPCHLSQGMFVHNALKIIRLRLGMFWLEWDKGKVCNLLSFWQVRQGASDEIHKITRFTIISRDSVSV